MLSFERNIKTLDDLALFAIEVDKLISTETIILLKGPLGVGKTAFTRELLKFWGNRKAVTSPTFTYFETYNCKRNNEDVIVYHFDLS